MEMQTHLNQSTDISENDTSPLRTNETPQVLSTSSSWHKNKCVQFCCLLMIAVVIAFIICIIAMGVALSRLNEGNLLIGVFIKI